MDADQDPIVVGYIDSDEGRAALEHALAEASRRDARLVVVHSTVNADDQLSAQQVFDDAAAGAPVDIEFRVVKGGSEAADALLAVIEQIHAQLIVIGVRRRSAVGKLFLGSNAQQILLEADCPVLAVKAGSRP